jgi:hypothetical protein
MPTYITCDDEHVWNVMLMICDMNACLTPRGVTDRVCTCVM